MRCRDKGKVMNGQSPRMAVRPTATSYRHQWVSEDERSGLPRLDSKKPSAYRFHRKSLVFKEDFLNEHKGG